MKNYISFIPIIISKQWMVHIPYDRLQVMWSRILINSYSYTTKIVESKYLKIFWWLISFKGYTYNLRSVEVFLFFYLLQMMIMYTIVDWSVEWFYQYNKFSIEKGYLQISLLWFKYIEIGINRFADEEESTVCNCISIALHTKINDEVSYCTY